MTRAPVKVTYDFRLGRTIPLGRMRHYSWTPARDRSIVSAMRNTIVACALAASAAITRPAAADDASEDRVTLPKHRVLVDVYLEANLSRGAAWSPVSLAPDLWFGATSDLTLGVVHSVAGETGFIDGYGSAVCLTGSSNGCPGVYNNVGLDVRYRLSGGAFTWALDSGLFFNSFSPFRLALKIGALGRWHTGRFALELQPAVFLGFTNRTTTVTMMGVTTTVTANGDDLSLPITGLVWLATRVALGMQVGVRIPFEDTSSTYDVSLSLGAHVVATDKLALTAAFSLTRVLGGANADAFSSRAVVIGGGNAGALDGRALVVGGAYAF
jgi:hypothetical protein